MFWIFSAILLLIFGSHDAVYLPSEIQKCSLSDPEYNSCMAEGINKGLDVFKEGSKDFGMPKLEPFDIQKIEIEAEPGKSVTLNQIYRNVKMHHVTNSKVVKFSRKLDNNSCSWEVEIHLPMSRMESDYELKGQVLIFPINSEGKCNVTLYNIINLHTCDCEQYTRKGKTYEKLKNYKMAMTVEKCVFQFDNLFPGNEQVGKELEKTLNENSLEIFEEVKHGFEKALAKIHENGANAVLTRLSLDELYLP